MTRSAPDRLPARSDKTETGFRILAMVAIVIVLYLASLYSYPLFHSLAELATIIVIFSACSIAFNSQPIVQNGYLLVLSAGFSSYALVILLHTLSYKGLGIFSPDPDLPTQLWIAGRYLLSLSFLVAGRFADRPARLAPLLITYAGVTMAVIVAIMHFKLFPVCFVQGVGLTPFKKTSEIIIAIIFSLSLADLVQKRSRFDVTVFRLIAATLVCLIVTELLFIWYVNVFGISNLLGHLVNLAGFALFHQAVVKTAITDPYRLIFLNLARSNQELETRVLERTAQLTETTRFLRESQTIARMGGWKSNPDTGMLYWTEETYKLLERSTDYELTHITGLEVFAPDHRDMVLQHLLRSWEHRIPFCIECKALTASGKMFWIEMRCNGRTDDAGTSYLSGTIQDITERKNVENSLIAAMETAESANRTKDEFLSTISHELRTPLNGIMGGAQLLNMTVLSDEQKEFLSVVTESAAKELTLVNDLLELTSIGSGRIRITREPFSIRDYIHALIRTHQPECAARGLSLLAETDEKLPELVVGDGPHLEQMVDTLISNAIKFSEQGTITVSATVISREGEQIRIGVTVADTGIGIPAAMLDKIFDPFVQADMSHTRKFGGTGLGLAICRRLSELMGGSITVESVEGRGSSFRLEFPFSIPPDEKAVSGESKVPGLPGRPLNVLVVEDDSMNQAVAKKALKMLGHSCALAENGAIGVEMWRLEQFDLVLMDILMPVMDGLEALRAIRMEESAHARRTPIVALTADLIGSTEQNMLAAGFDAYLTKPFKFKQLQEVITRLTAAY